MPGCAVRWDPGVTQKGTHSVTCMELYLKDTRFSYTPTYVLYFYFIKIDKGDDLTPSSETRNTVLLSNEHDHVRIFMNVRKMYDNGGV